MLVNNNESHGLRKEKLEMILAHEERSKINDSSWLTWYYHFFNCIYTGFPIPYFLSFIIHSIHSVFTPETLSDTDIVQTVKMKLKLVVKYSSGLKPNSIFALVLIHLQ